MCCHSLLFPVIPHTRWRGIWHLPSLGVNVGFNLSFKPFRVLCQQDKIHKPCYSEQHIFCNMPCIHGPISLRVGPIATKSSHIFDREKWKVRVPKNIRQIIIITKTTTPSTIHQMLICYRYSTESFIYIFSLNFITTPWGKSFLIS